MSRTIRTVVLLASGAVLLSFGILVVNQTAQVVQLVEKIDPTLGSITLWTLVIAYAGLLGVPVVLFIRLPSPLLPPESEDCPAFETHLKRLGERLASSPHLTGHVLCDRPGIEAALRVLDGKADQIVRETASSVFLATAVSQSGRLDGLLVLAAQSRMVWQLAHLYHQRPTLRDLTHLYANVAGTAFVAGELQDLDLGEQVEPVLSAAIGALGASLPGFQVAGSILANCVLSGSANAFLTLRVGLIAKRYCGALVIEPKASLRRAATTEAAGHLGAIVADGSARLTKAIWRASADKFGGAVSGVSGYAKDAGVKLLARVRNGRVQEQPEVG
jgi:hypothetical protein